MKLQSQTLILFLSSFFFLSFVTSCNQQQPPIKIGLAINLSGRGGEAGEHIRDGAILAVDNVNKAGGINGRSLELLIRDDQNSDEGIIQADESLIDAGVVAIIGHSFSSNTIKAHPLVTSRDTILITAYTASTELSGQDDLFFRTAVDCSLFGKKMATLLQKKEVQSVAFLMDMTNSAFVLDYVNRVRAHFTGPVTEVKFNSREHADWDRIMDELLEPRRDAIILLTEASMTGVALQKIAATDFNGSRIATIWAQTPELIRHAGDSAEGLSIITYVDPDNSRPDYLKFAREIEEKLHNKATARSTRAYEMVMILADALGRCSSISSGELKKALLAGEYDTLMGHVKFDQYGDVVRPVYEVIVRDKQFRNNGEI
ncbi:ABC-type branched-chain amino acid transport system, periplasmic component [Desulfocapsa sulfexigens DSM 10523]|uniref:ABC-type branched-chain amino acid transport system, periplasmic component n=1 Tax=Desulfocapsa sulfexigens (strain DSM 10523 / SB164P1) TaxID=1167006 RepID=M1P0G8_DESSD|nr:ABC transporter substrate-binding protein [Desulfocapsa sulfexigens]AGF76978.1 ABC-type branched-chain amino acid transport system, periplasmic component [Desulfocapsa sulfexigens DSM 10523]